MFITQDGPGHIFLFSPPVQAASVRTNQMNIFGWSQNKECLFPPCRWSCFWHLTISLASCLTEGIYRILYRAPLTYGHIWGQSHTNVEIISGLCQQITLVDSLTSAGRCGRYLVVLVTEEISKDLQHMLGVLRTLPFPCVKQPLVWMDQTKTHTHTYPACTFCP